MPQRVAPFNKLCGRKMRPFGFTFGLQVCCPCCACLPPSSAPQAACSQAEKGEHLHSNVPNSKHGTRPSCSAWLHAMLSV